MNVKEARELLTDCPEGMSQDEFDGLTVLFETEPDTFFSPCECETGVIEFDDPHDDLGNRVELSPKSNTNLAFMFAKHNF